MVNLDAVRNLYCERSVFLICGGPSFNKLNHDKLNQCGILTMGVNNSPRTYRPDMWCAVDPTDTFIKSIYEDQTIIKFRPMYYAKREKSPCIGFRTNLDFDPDSFIDEDTVNYGSGKKNGGGRSVMLAAVKILITLGFKKIFLLGVDFRMDPSGKPYHFDESSNRHSVKSNNRTYGILSDRFRKLLPKIREAGVEIFNCNESSSLNIFPYKSFDECIDISTSSIPKLEEERTIGMYADGLKNIKCGKQIVVSGMPRSGNHILIDWICSQFNDRVEFRNNISHTNTVKFLLSPEETGMPERLWSVRSKKKMYDGDINLFLSSRENETNISCELPSRVKPKSNKQIILLRDPFNHMASTLKYFRNKGAVWFEDSFMRADKYLSDFEYTYVRKWIEYAKAYQSGDFISVNFNLFVDSSEYRKSIADKIGTDFVSDNAMLFVPNNGGGSSFDNVSMDGHADEMKTGERWKKYIDDDFYIEMFEKHPELISISRNIFGETEAAVEILKRIESRRKQKGSREKLSIVIPCQMETRLERTINRIKATCSELPEVVIVFDGDRADNYCIDYPAEKLIIIENERPIGTGPSRDIGVRAATGEVVFNIDSHVDWVNGSDWYNKIYNLSLMYPDDILCCKMRTMNIKKMVIDEDSGTYTGAEIFLKVKVVNDGIKLNAISARWSDNKIGVIPCCMGAGYAFKRDRYINVLRSPWSINQGWGHDEETISIVNWICGGDTRLIDVDIGHVFDVNKTRLDYGSDRNALIWANRLAMIEYLPMKEERRDDLRSWIDAIPFVVEHRDEIDEVMPVAKINSMKKYLEKMERTFEDFIKKFECKNLIKESPRKKRKINIFPKCEFIYSGKKSIDRMYTIFTLPRSGSHMLADWIGSQIEGGSRFVSGINLGDHRRNNINIFNTGTQKLPSVNDSCGNVSTYITTMEGADPSITGVPWIDSKKSYKIILLRDPANWLSSYLSSGFKVLNHSTLDEAWLQYARAFVTDDDTIVVNYNTFASSKAYRDKLAGILHLDIRSDRSIENISLAGGGSSFDKMKYDGMASKMKVLDRWGEILTTKEFRKFCGNNEIKRYEAEIFGQNILTQNG